MNALDRELRRKLEKTVREARRVAEAGAVKILEQLAVGRHEPHTDMDPEARRLRNRLRAMAGSSATNATRTAAARLSTGWSGNVPTNTGTAHCLPASSPKAIC